MTQPTKDELTAAKNAINDAFSELYPDETTTLNALLDQAINAPDLSELVVDTSNTPELLSMCADFTVGYNNGWNAAIDHLAPRIVREGMVVVDATEYQQLKNIQNALQANINLIAASRGD